MQIQNAEASRAMLIISGSQALRTLSGSFSGSQMAVPAYKHPQGLAVTVLSYFKWQVILMNTPTLTSSIIVNVKVLQMEELLISIIYIAWQKVVYKNKCLKHLLEGAKIFFGMFTPRFFDHFSSWGWKTYFLL